MILLRKELSQEYLVRDRDLSPESSYDYTVSAGRD